MMKYLLRILIFAISVLIYANVSARTDIPVIGAQVFIEPGQTDEEIELWFKRLNESGMTVCRIRMFEEYMKSENGMWNFELFDKAFRAAEKYNIKVFATLFPATPDNAIGGFKFPLSQEHEEQIAIYINKTVNHFKQFKSFYSWVLINEPGTGGAIPQTAYTKQKFESWKKKQRKPIYNSKGYPLLIDFDKKKFLVDYNTWYLSWIAKEVAKYDTQSHIHVNNHQIFENVAEYDFIAWRSFLSSLGASAHPSWHFGYFDRNKYTMALAANCEIIRSGAGDLPFWVTELQGGNNTYSGSKAFCPTKEEIIQWLWTSIGTGAEGIIFWCLNPRSVGEEAGEWALLDFQNNASDRMKAAKEVVNCLESNKDVFSSVRPIESPISILYVRESLWVESKVQYSDPKDTDYEGRLAGSVMKSTLAYYDVLAESGIKSNLKEMAEFDWSKKDYSGETVILANQIAIPSYYWENIRSFVRNGGKLIVEGLSAFYDENMLSLYNTGFPLSDVFGGTLCESKCIPGDFEVFFKKMNYPVHLWKGFIANKTGVVIAKEDAGITATRNRFGKGEVVWIPSLLGLGAKRSNNGLPLSLFLQEELKSQCKLIPFSFSSFYENIYMQTLQYEKGYLTIFANKGLSLKRVELVNSKSLNPRVLFADKKGWVEGNSVIINPEETLVIKWE